MNRSKKLGLLLAVLTVVCVATLLLSRHEQKQERIKNSDAVILQIPGDAVTALSWEYTQGEGLAFHKTADGWKYDGDEAFPVSEEKVAQILAHFETFGVGFVIENVEDYGQYGLDKPACTLHIATEEDAFDIRLGDFSQMDEQRYVDIGDGNVYLVSDDPMNYVESSLSGMIANDDTPGFEKVVDIRFSGGETQIIQRLDDSGYSYSDADIYFVQQNGKYLPLDKAAVTKYLNTITSLNLTDYVTYNATAEELTAYGLASPELSVTINYTRTDQESGQTEADVCVIHIGRNQEELEAAREAEAKGENAPSVTAYVRVGESQIIYPLDAVSYGILTAASYDDLRHKEVFWADFDDVYRIDISLEGNDHTLWSEKNADDARVFYYQTDDGEIAEETEKENALDLTELRDALKALCADSFTTQSPSGKEEIRLTLSLDNDSFPKSEIVLYRYDGTSCLAVVDGVSVSLVPRASAMELVEAVQAIVLNG